MVDPRNRTHRDVRSLARSRVQSLPETADGSMGMTNLASVPRAGNISSDTRAG
jgi:hypothetical protein